MNTKKQAQTAKTEVQKRLGKTDASVGLTKTNDGSYAVLVSFKSKPTKKLIKELSKGLDVKVETEVVETVAALPIAKNPSPSQEGDQEGCEESFFQKVR